MNPFARLLRMLALWLALLSVSLPAPAWAFCGFYVAKADTKLFNQASQVVLARDGKRTVITMSNDFQGDPVDFAVVVPVPTFLEREQIHVTERGVIDHLDAYTAPRLVEYFDGDPCAPVYPRSVGRMDAVMALREDSAERARSLGVTIEATYTVGEYDILILSAEESAGLVTWLLEEGYRLPEGAEPVVGSYLEQDMRFFVARVNLEEQSKLGFSYLRPLQVAYESERFMLPIRLGTVNADGPQELFVYALTRKGRVETTNYRTVKLPTGMDVPGFVKAEFGDFYKAMFAEQVRREDMRAVFLEYAWDMSWCDPCAADPLSNAQLRELGAFWIPEADDGGDPRPGRFGGDARDAFVTRLHVRYDAAHFPEDLVFQETGDRQNFQGRYVLRHPFEGDTSCEAGQRYVQQLPERREAEARNLANLTGWEIAAIREKMGAPPEGPAGAAPAADGPWWRRLWRN